MKILILGAPGSGKSFLAKQAKEHNLPAYDSDYDIPNLCGWRDKDGKIVQFPKEVTVEWLETHTFSWNEKVLDDFLALHPDILIFGIAANAFLLTPLFDSVYYLQIDKETLQERLLHSKERKNARGKTQDEVEQIWRDIHKDHMPEVQQRNIKIIDATNTAERILSEITPN